jgi:AAA15 family ATPase/GTPase
MQKIDNIEIKNFKSIRHQKIEGCKKINVFIGYPNVGKSNILEALSLFAINEGTSFTDLIRVKEDPTIFFNGFLENDLIVSLNNEVAVLGSYSNGSFIMDFQVSVNRNNEFLKQNPNLALNGSVRKELQFKNFKFSASKSGNLNLKIIEEYIVKKYQFSNALLKSDSNYITLQYPFGNNIFSVLYSNEKLNRDSVELLKEYDLELVFDNRDQQFTILKRTGSRIFTVPYELLADTLQRLIFYKAAIFSNKDRILLFEEPEAHMFPPYIRKLTTDIVLDKNENQYFIATHSPYVLDELIEDAGDDLAVYLVDYKNGETIVHNLSKDDLNEIREYGVDLFFNIESYLKHGQINNS